MEPRHCALVKSAIGCCRRLRLCIVVGKLDRKDEQAWAGMDLAAWKDGLADVLAIR
jgi:hypothetical protein